MVMVELLRQSLMHWSRHVARAIGHSLRRAFLPTCGAFTLVVLLSGHADAQDKSTCYGSTSNGSLENGWKLPSKGSNFSAYSSIGSTIGRTYVHSDVHGVILAAYAALETTLPRKFFVYGETGRKSGGKFEPHKTHQNGLSVDFMVPVVDVAGESVPLPTNALNRWGYDLEFDSDGHADGLRIDAEAMSEHIYQLHRATMAEGIGIWRVIFAPELQPLLHTTRRWPYLHAHVEFSKKRSWVRHDEHYHLDFVVQCQPGDQP